ncbi:MAG: LysR family transcriptional regulator, partial [Lachnospiraceae bacterium]|nr:LysR family transcriptional regulator [Lachnospiraceae bacterium]
GEVMNINYEYYKAFYYVGKYQNITKAAQALGSNQPNVTRIMKLLESEFGFQLLLRSNKGITLTEKGEILYERISTAFFQIQAAEEELTRNGKMIEGTIILGTTETALHLILFQKLKEFKRNNPKVRFKIYNYSTKDAVYELTRGAIDISVVTSPFHIKKHMRSEKLMEFKDVLICGRDYIGLTQQKRHLTELVDYPWVCLGKNTVTYDMTSDFFLRNGIVLKPDIEVTTSDLMVPMIQNNLGIGYVPEQLAEKALEEGAVFRVPVYEEMETRAVCVLYDMKRVQSRCEKEFLACLLSFPVK